MQEYWAYIVQQYCNDPTYSCGHAEASKKGSDGIGGNGGSGGSGGNPGSGGNLKGGGDLVGGARATGAGTGLVDLEQNDIG